ncbi:hypothetical protein V5O48_019421 [Marasmius crinis-equi]|uniref:Uncharacterized protein n=1 Tax=Marasmius crinis-equi TaxID=585013 RepID=A0ABR3EIH3_9AGAR
MAPDRTQKSRDKNSKSKSKQAPPAPSGSKATQTQTPRLPRKQRRQLAKVERFIEAVDSGNPEMIKKFKRCGQYWARCVALFQKSIDSVILFGLKTEMEAKLGKTGDQEKEKDDDEDDDEEDDEEDDDEDDEEDDDEEDMTTLDIPGEMYPY